MGGLADAMFSYADVEANYQGFLMLRAMVEGDDAHLQQVDGHWVLARPINIRPYVTPGFDESYNVCHYTRARRRSVPATLQDQYAEAYNSLLVRERFAQYDAYEPSLSQRIVDRIDAERGITPREEQGLIDLVQGSAAEPDFQAAADSGAAPGVSTGSN